MFEPLKTKNINGSECLGECLSRDLMRELRRMLDEDFNAGIRGRSINETLTRITTRKAPGYYLTPAYALRRLRRIRHSGLNLLSEKSKMKWHEIDKRTRRLEEKLGLKDSDALTLVISSEASGFFIKPKTAKRIMQRHLKEKRTHQKNLSHDRNDI